MKQIASRSQQASTEQSNATSPRSTDCSDQALIGNEAIQERMKNNTGVPSRFSYGAQTYCDLSHNEWSKDLQTKLAARQDLPVSELGSGTPKVRYFSSFGTLGPGMQKIVREHEKVHVDNARPYSASFKAQIDRDASTFFGLTEPEIAADDYIRAFNDNFGGLHPSCEEDEKMAYARSVEVANELLADPAYAAEHDTIRNNLALFTAQSASPTTCK